MVKKELIGTPELLCIWLLEVLNYSVHELFRPVPWNAASRAFGYTFWAIQSVCFFCFQFADPGSVPGAWEALAAAGKVQASVDGKSGRLVPARARYCRRASKVVLCLDHYCHWLGTPVGFANRKLFILFCGYSAFLLGVGSAHCIHDLMYGAPSRLGVPTLPATLFPTGGPLLRAQVPPSELLPAVAILPERLARTVADLATIATAVWAWGGTLAATAQELDAAAAAGLRDGVCAAPLSRRPGSTSKTSTAPVAASTTSTSPASTAATVSAAPVDAHGPTWPCYRWHRIWLVGFGLTVVLNPIASLLLAFLTCHQLLLTLFNRTSIEPTEARYDLGFAHNWRVVFGCRPLLWLLPIPPDPDSSGIDGIHWEESSRWRAMQDRAERIRAIHQQSNAPSEGVRLNGGSEALLLDPSDHVPPPQGYTRPLPSPTASGGGSGGRWALGRHQSRTAASLRESLTALRKLKALLRAWEERLCCGLMAMGSVRLLHKLFLRWRDRWRSGSISSRGTPRTSKAASDGPARPNRTSPSTDIDTPPTLEGS